MLRQFYSYKFQINIIFNNVISLKIFSYILFNNKQLESYEQVRNVVLIYLLETNYYGVIIVKNKKKQNKSNEAVKTAGNNQWTNNNTKYYPDERERQDGPGGN